MLQLKQRCLNCGARSHLKDRCPYTEQLCFRCDQYGHRGYNCKVNGWNLFRRHENGGNNVSDERLLIFVGGRMIKALIYCDLNHNLIGLNTAITLNVPMKNTSVSFLINGQMFVTIATINVLMYNGKDSAVGEIHVLPTNVFAKIHNHARIIIGSVYVNKIKSIRAVERFRSTSAAMGQTQELMATGTGTLQRSGRPESNMAVESFGSTSAAMGQTQELMATIQLRLIS